MEKLVIPDFETKKELYDFLMTNKDSLIAQKCSAIKFADGFEAHVNVLKNEVGVANKSTFDENQTELTVKAVINTTNIMDSHGDVHLKGIWNKSLKENKRIMMLQEHKSNQFDKIIASGDDLNATVKTYTWKELGYDVDGETQALVFEAKVKKDRNPFMFEQYKQGYVDNHSVGMQYVKLNIAVNDEDYPLAKELYDNHINEIANKADVEAKGYFWAVAEAKAIEGSAVPNGSNKITPTLSVKHATNVVEKTAKDLAIRKFLGLD